MGKLTLIIIQLFVTSSLCFSYISRFLDLSVDSLEYKVVSNPESYSLKIAGLVASGVGEKEIEKYISIIDNFENSLSKKLIGKKPIEKAKLIFDEMHTTFFKTYGEFYNTLDLLLQSGRFNCLSATLLYSIFLEDYGFNFKVMALPTHVFTVLYVDDGEIDIENTSPNGFDIRTNLSAQQAFRKMTGFDYTRSPDKVQLLDKKGLIASMYANFAFIDAKNKNYYSAFQNAIKAYAICPEGRLIVSNTVSAYIEYVNFLKEKREFEKAISISKEAMEMLPDKTIFTNLYYSVLDGYLAHLVKNTNEDIAISIIEREEKNGKLPIMLKENFYIYIYNKKLSSGRKDFEGLYQIFKKASVEMKDSVNFKELVLASFFKLVEEETKNWKRGLSNEENILKWRMLLPESEDVRKILKKYYIDIAYNFFKNDDIETSIMILKRGKKILSEAEEFDRMLASFYITKGITCAENGDYENALYYFKLARNIRENDKNILQNMRNIYRLRVYKKIEEKDYKTAKLLVEEGLKDFPDDEKLLYYKEYLREK